MSVFTWLFGDSNSANSTVEKAGKMLDDAFYTDQEKANNKNKVLDWYLKYQEATAPQNVARRIIALIVTALWAFLVLLAVTVHFFEPEHVDGIFSDFIFKTLSENVNTPFSIIIGFYFAAHLMRGLKK